MQILAYFDSLFHHLITLVLGYNHNLGEAYMKTIFYITLKHVLQLTLYARKPDEMH